MRIGLLTHTTGGRGGIEQVVDQHAHGLRSLGHDVDVMSGPVVGRGWWARAVAGAGMLALRTETLTRYDVLLAHYPPSAWVAARSGAPFVHFMHHPLRALYPTQTMRLDLQWRLLSRGVQPLRHREHAAVRAASVVAVPSPAVLRDCQRLYGRQAVLTPLGVDTTLFSPKDGVVRVGALFVGRLDAPYKHLDWAVDVARELGEELHVVGEGTAPAGLAEQPHVRMRGFLSGQALVEAYRAAAVLLFPSVQEDFGLVPLEAMACGLPVVAWRDGYGPSWTMGPGSGGVLAKPYELDDFAARARAVLQDLEVRGALSAAGPAWTASRFGLEAHVRAVEALLEDAAARA